MDSSLNGEAQRHITAAVIAVWRLRHPPPLSLSGADRSGQLMATRFGARRVKRPKSLAQHLLNFSVQALVDLDSSAFGRLRR